MTWDPNLVKDRLGVALSSGGPVCVVLTDSNLNVGVTVWLASCVGRVEDSMHLLI